MVKATFQLYNENDKEGDPSVITFDNEDDMYLWMRNQMGHPWLSYQLVSKEIINENKTRN